MSAESLRNLQTWLVCSTIGTALKPDVATVRDWIDSLAALASPPPQATGALREPVGEIVGTEKRGFALMTVVRWAPGFNRTKVGTLLYAAVSQVEPEDKHG